MPLSLAQIDQLSKSPAYCQLPIQLAQEANLTDFIAQSKAVLEFGAEMELWRILQCARVVLETYGEAVSTLNLQWGEDQDSGGVYFNEHVYINDEEYHPDCMDVSQGTLQVLEQIDGEKAIATLFHHAQNALHSALFSFAPRYNELLTPYLEEVEDVDALLAKLNPKVVSALQALEMEMNTASAAPVRTSPRI